MFEYGFDDSMSLQDLSDGLRAVQECDWCAEKAALHHGGEQYCRACWNERHVTETTPHDWNESWREDVEKERL